jgi:FKBP-type peptidyl-prolyl cis-trans isomerase
MSKKNEKEKDEEKDLEEEEADEEDEEEGDEDEDEDEDDEDEEPAAAAKGVDDRRARAHARRASHDAHGDHDDDEDEDDATDEDDPYWWTPHAVMAALVLVGVLGFFGVFNKALGGLAAHPVAHAAAEEKASPTSTGAAARPTSTTAPAVPEDVKAPPASAQKTASGLAYRLIKKGTGTQSPKATDTVVVNYTGWTTDGKMFDSSITRGQPATFKLNQVIPGWTEGVQLMHEGETVRFWIPAALAYGSKPRAGAPAGDLTFDVELISIR